LSEAAKVAIKAIDGKYPNFKNKEKPMTNQINGFSTLHKNNNNNVNVNVNTYKSNKKINIFNVNFQKVSSITSDLIFSSNCVYCDKPIETIPQNSTLGVIFQGKEGFCINCFKKKYYNPVITNDLIRVSYRKLFGYIYEGIVVPLTAKHQYHFGNFEFKETLTQHILIGLKNPLFAYSEETMQWEIDVSLVREGKVPIGYIFKTIALQMMAIGIHEIFHKAKPYMIYQNTCKLIENAINDKTTADCIIYPSPFQADVPWTESSYDSVPESVLNVFSLDELEKKKKY
jgi:hypothetical protein